MNAVSNYEKIINSPVWKRERTPTFNYICRKPNCYSNCPTGRFIVIDWQHLKVRRGRCDQCSHSHLFHLPSHSKWVEKQESWVTVDDDMKLKWEAAKDENEKTAALVATSERTLGDLSHTIDEGMDELVRSADEYAGLSLSGCFSGPLEKAIRLLEAHCECMEEQGVSRDQLGKMRASLEDMKRRLDLLKTAKKKGMVTKAKKAWGAVHGGAKATKSEFCNWLDGHEPQPTTEIMPPCEKSQDIESKITSTLAQMGQAAEKMAEIKKLLEEVRNGTAVSFHLPSL